MEYQEPSDADKELTRFVSDHCDRWRNHRDQNYLDLWLEYERIYRGIWDDTDKTRESERSRVITPGTQQAVETRHAEIMEAIFGQGEFFDIQDNLQDVDGNKLDVELIKAQLAEDFKKDKIRKSIDQIELMAEIYGTGIGEIIVKTEKEYIPATKPIPGSPQAAIGVEEKDRIAVKINPINPKNFLFDPNGSSIEECMGVAVEKFVSIHKVVENIEKGNYRKVKIGIDPDDENLDPTQELMQFKDEKVRLLTYYGLVPREYLKATETETVEELFPEDDATEDYSDMVEAIVVIANGNLLLKAEENPYMMKDRPIIAYQDDTVPNRLLGRGTVEKAYNMQKATDAQIRNHLDSLALTTSPMMAMDATRLPRGAKFEVKPGKAILTNGSPTEVLMPFKFGNTDGQNLQTAQVFQQLLLQATGTLDANGMVSSVSRDANSGGISMAVASIIKKYKRTLTNFQEDFLIPFIKKAAFRYMQFDPERYPTVDYNFIPTATLGIIAREYEQQQFIALLQTLGPNTPVMPLILKGIVGNSSFTNRYELMAALDQMSQPDPQAQQLSLAQQQLALQAAQAQIALNTTQAEQNRAEAAKAMVEAQLLPEETRAKITASLTQNLPDQDAAASKEFERRVKIAELMLKEADIKNKSKIVELQMSDRKQSQAKVENDFLEQLSKELSK
jgi:hypothetical protein